MSSFFTLPASQRKRKREDRVGAPATKKRGVDAKKDAGGKGSKKSREREESISGSDIDEDGSIASGVSEEESDAESDEGETVADRRLKLAERYLDNVRDEVDDYGFDAAEIDRDLIAERLKEDVVCAARRPRIFFTQDQSQLTSNRTNSKDGSTVRSPRTWPSRTPPARSSGPTPKRLRLLPSTRPTSTLSPRTEP